MIGNRKSVEFNKNLKLKKDLGVQIALFISLCSRLRECCLDHKDSFKDSRHNIIYIDPVSMNEVRIYFNNNYEDCAVYSGRTKFSFWSKDATFEKALDIYDNTVESNRLLKEAIAHMENSCKPKRRSLNFMK